MEPEAPNIQARTLGDTLQKLRKETSKMVWQVNVLPTKPQDLDSVLGTHMLEGENCLQPGVLFLPHAHCGTCVRMCAPIGACAYTHRQGNNGWNEWRKEVSWRGSLCMQMKQATNSETSKIMEIMVLD